MLDIFMNFALLAQPAATPTTGGASGGASAGAFGGGMQVFMLLAMVAVMYFVVLRPQQQQQKTHDEFLKALKRGDRVRTSSGIRGEVAEINEKDVNLVIAERVKINILKSQLAGLDSSEAPAEAQKASS